MQMYFDQHCYNLFQNAFSGYSQAPSDFKPSPYEPS